MKLPIIVTTLLNLFATSPDLCAEPFLDLDGTPCTDSIGQTLSRYCKWTGPEAPVFDGNVCCAIDDGSAACWLPSGTGSTCPAGSLVRYCEYGEKLRSGVICYQPFPSTCDLGHCVAAPQVPPDVQAELACCNGGGCVPLATMEIWDCEDWGSTITWCHDGVSNLDGTITCYD